MTRARSPWQRALGAGVDQLDPGLRTYFSAIEPGFVGKGKGTFTSVGTPRRWLWPLLAVLALDDIVFAVWEHDVPFTVQNRPGPGGTVRATRTFHFASGDRTMVDTTGISAAGLVDRLGRRGLVEAQLSASVVGGALRLTSHGITLRLGPIRVPLGLLSPRVTLVEQREGVMQHVSLRLYAPLVGLVYQYEGNFTYHIEPGE